MTLQQYDLRDLVDNILEIDGYKSKMGADKDIVTVAFATKTKESADDLASFIERGYTFVLDADATSGEQADGTYKQLPIAPMVDKGITMQDILEDGYATDVMTNADGKSHCLTARYNGAVWWNSIERKQRTMVLKDNPTVSRDGLIRVGTADLKGHDSIKRVYAQEGKAPTLTTMQGGHREPKVAIGRIVNRRLDEHGTRKDDQLDLPFTRQLEVRADEKSNCLTTVQKDNVVVAKDMWRKLTPLECERLQTLPDNYTNHVSNSQRYKMIGNGWTVDVIAHILKGIQLDETWNEMYNETEERV